MVTQEADVRVEIGTDTARRSGGLAPVPDGAPDAPHRCPPDSLVRLTAVAERVADLDLEGMLADVSRLLGTPAALVSPDGAALAGDVSAVPSPERLRATSRALTAGRAPQHFGAAIMPVRDGSGAVLAYLCLDGGSGLADAHFWPMLGALLAAAAVVQLDRREQAQRAEGDFLRSLLFAGEDFPEPELDGWAGRLGIDLATPRRVVFLPHTPLRSRRPLEQVQWLRQAVTATVGRSLLAEVRDGVVCLAADPAPGSARHWVRAWEPLLPHLADAGIGGVTVGGAFTGVPGVRRSYRQARALAERQRSGARVLAAPGVSVYEEGGLTEIVLGHPDTENLQAYVRRVLGPLLDDARFGGELAGTLQAYLATGGSPAGAAELLHLHPSSVKYRMRVIRDLLGGGELDDHDRRFELELALRMYRALRDRDDTSRPGQTNGTVLSSRRADVAAGARP